MASDEWSMLAAMLSSDADKGQSNYVCEIGTFGQAHTCCMHVACPTCMHAQQQTKECMPNASLSRHVILTLLRSIGWLLLLAEPQLGQLVGLRRYDEPLLKLLRLLRRE